jgi:hypothetical protein
VVIRTSSVYMYILSKVRSKGQVESGQLYTPPKFIRTIRGHPRVTRQLPKAASEETVLESSYARIFDMR